MTFYKKLSLVIFYIFKKNNLSVDEIVFLEFTNRLGFY